MLKPQKWQQSILVSDLDRPQAEPICISFMTAVGQSLHLKIAMTYWSWQHILGPRHIPGEALRAAKVISARIERGLKGISWYFSAHIPLQCAIEIALVDSSQPTLLYLSSCKSTILSLSPQKPESLPNCYNMMYVFVSERVKDDPYSQALCTVRPLKSIPWAARNGNQLELPYAIRGHVL